MDTKTEATIGEMLVTAMGAFASSGVDTPQLDAEVMMAHAVGKSRIYAIAHPNQVLKPEELQRFNEFVERRRKREPLAYIVGEKEFWGISFKVKPGVLVPRPETETLVEAALSEMSGITGPAIVDIGTGTGCIAIALALELPDAMVYATECSETALEVAQYNVCKHQVESRVHIMEGSLLAPVPKKVFGRLDSIVSNPPYIPSGEINTLQPEVADYEPRGALDGGKDGLRFYTDIIRDAHDWLKPGGWLHLEVGAGQAEEVAAIAQAYEFIAIQTRRDLAGIGRVVSCRKAF
jgi:release factor glutamine methyltransferase